MRYVRLAGLALVGTALTACSNSITGPATPDAPLNTGYLLSSGSKAPLKATGYLLSSGRAKQAGTATGTSAGTGTAAAVEECRTGYLLSSGRCGQ